jgi:hypothetical protein
MRVASSTSMGKARARHACSRTPTNLRTRILCGLEHYLFHLIMYPIHGRSLLARGSRQISTFDTLASEVGIEPLNFACASDDEYLINAQLFELGNTPGPGCLSTHTVLEPALPFQQEYSRAVFSHRLGQGAPPKPPPTMIISYMGNRLLLLNKCGQFQSVSQRRRCTAILAVFNGVACLVAGRYNDEYVSDYSLLEIDYEADVSCSPSSTMGCPARQWSWMPQRRGRQLRFAAMRSSATARGAAKRELGGQKDADEDPQAAR